MNNNLKALLDNIDNDQGRLINQLIGEGIINIDYLVDEVIKSKDAKNIYKVAKYVKNTSFDKLVKAIISTNDIEYIYYFALNVDNAPLDLFADYIIKSGKSNFIYCFARDIKNAPIEKLADAIIKINNGEEIYCFARDIKNAPIEKLAEAVISSKSPEYIYKFAKNISVDNYLGKFTDAIISTSDEYYIYAFAKNVKNAPIDKLADAIMNSNSKSFLLLTQDLIKEKKQKDPFSLEKLTELVNENKMDKVRKDKEKFKNLFIDEPVKKKTKK